MYNFHIITKPSANPKTCLKSEGNFEVREKKHPRNLEKTRTDVLVHSGSFLSGAHFFLARPSPPSIPGAGPLPLGNVRRAGPATKTETRVRSPNPVDTRLFPSWPVVPGQTQREKEDPHPTPTPEGMNASVVKVMWPEGRRVGHFA